MSPPWQWLQDAGAQSDVVEWARPYEDDFARLWRECPRGDWLLAMAARLGAERKALTLAACHCARLSLAHLPEGEERPALALAALEAWSRGEGDALACKTHRVAVEDVLDAAEDPASSAALVAITCAIDTIADAEAAPNAVAFAIQAAVLDAGDCAMVEAMRFTQRRSAQLVRDAISPDAAQQLWREA